MTKETYSTSLVLSIKREHLLDAMNLIEADAMKVAESHHSHCPQLFPTTVKLGGFG